MLIGLNPDNYSLLTNNDLSSALTKLNQGLVTNSQNSYQQDNLQLSVPSSLNTSASFNFITNPPLTPSYHNLSSVLGQMKQEDSLIQDLYTQSLDMRWPVDSTRITSDFGYRTHPIYGDQRHHDGVDIGAGSGSNIYAAASGVVTLSGVNGGYGNTVMIDHGNGVKTVYGHASQLYVGVGQYVSKGDIIAAVGSTGVSTGPHLHFEVRQNNEQVDPLDFVNIYS